MIMGCSLETGQGTMKVESVLVTGMVAVKSWNNSGKQKCLLCLASVGSILHSSPQVNIEFKHNCFITTNIIRFNLIQFIDSEYN